MRNIIDITSTIPKHPWKKWSRRKVNPTRIILHTTASDNQDPMRTARYHVMQSEENRLSKSGAPSLAYHDFIDRNGLIYHCNDYMDITWHAKSYNTSSIGIVMAFRGQDNIEPAALQYESTFLHLVDLALKFRIPPSRIIGHREVPGMFSIIGKGSVRYRKTCPGMKIDLNLLRKRVGFHMEAALYSAGVLKTLLGEFGSEATEALKQYEN